jgi:hypothetical protein
MLGHTHAIAGNREQAKEVLTQLDYESRSRYISPYDIAIIHAGLGDHDAAIAKLKDAFEDRSSWMVFMEVDPRLDALREEREFVRLVARFRGYGVSQTS